MFQTDKLPDNLVEPYWLGSQSQASTVNCGYRNWNRGKSWLNQSVGHVVTFLKVYQGLTCIGLEALNPKPVAV